MSKTTKKFEFVNARDAQYVIDNDFLYPNYMVESAKKYIASL